MPKLSMKKVVNAYKAHGPEKGLEILTEAFLGEDDKGELDPGRQRADDFSLYEVFEDTIGNPRDVLGNGKGLTFLTEAFVDSNAFSDIIGVLLAQKITEAYTLVPSIGDSLVSVMQSRRKSERYAGFKATEQPKEVLEGMPYEESELQDKYSTSEANKYGRLLNVTEEAILFDQTGQLLMRASGIGEKARYHRENLIIEGVTDANSTVFSPQGAAEALYRVAVGTNSNIINRLATNALVDWTDIDNAMQVFADMTDDQGELIVSMPNTLLVPYALDATAKRVVNATEVRTTSGATITTIGSNPVTGLTVLSSPLVDAQSSTTWYLGNFPREFVWQEIWPLQVTRTRLPQLATVQDVIVTYKTRYFGGISAIDDVYVVQNTA